MLLFTYRVEYAKQHKPVNSEYENIPEPRPELVAVLARVATKQLGARCGWEGRRASQGRLWVERAFGFDRGFSRF